MKKIIYILSILVLLSLQSKADSPLTSTDFYKAYGNEQIIRYALQSKGNLDLYLIDYLMNPQNPTGTKLAVVNALSWDINGRNNAEQLWNEYLGSVYKSKDHFLKKGSASELIVYAYSKSLDNYHNVEEALTFADRAVSKNNDSYAIAIIQSLIKAQSLFGTDWCQVYYVTHRVQLNKGLKMDLLTSASDIIFEYMDLYKDYCK